MTPDCPTLILLFRKTLQKHICPDGYLRAVHFIKKNLGRRQIPGRKAWERVGTLKLHLWSAQCSWGRWLHHLLGVSLSVVCLAAARSQVGTGHSTKGQEEAPLVEE